MKNNPQLLATGQDSLSVAKKYLNQPSKVEAGGVRLESGMVLPSGRMLIYVSSHKLVYLELDRLYLFGTQAFIRDENFIAMARGVKSAEWFVTVAQFEVTFLIGIFVPFYLLLGLTAGKSAIIYYSHKKEFDLAFKYAPRIIINLIHLREKHRTLFNKIAFQSLKEVINNLPSGITNEDIAFFLGRCIKGAAGLPDIALRPLLKVIIKTALAVSFTHLPSVISHTMANQARSRLEYLDNKLKQAGIYANHHELHLIIRDLDQDKHFKERLRQLESDCISLIPVLETLKGIIRSS